MADGSITIETILDTKEFDQQILQVERRVNEIEKELAANKKLGFLSEKEVQELNVELEKTNNKLITLRQQKEKASQVDDVNRLSESFNDVGSSVQNSIKKVARLALGIFGIRSAYMALRRASSDLASYDQQYATNLEYIRYALTQMIAPVLKYIVNLAATLLGYINAIVQGWFGINLFARGSVDNFKQMKTQASGVGKAVKEIKKQLMGFDEMNVLQEDGSTSTGGGGGGITMPEFDLSAMQGEVPQWLQWIIDNRNLILSIITGIAIGLTAWKLGLSGIKALGIGALISGILITIIAIKQYLEAPTWENFGKVIVGIGVFLAGLLALIVGFPGVIIGVAVAIVGIVISNWQKIQSFLQKGIDWLIGKSNWVHEMFGYIIGSFYDYFVSRLQALLNFIDSQFKVMKQIFDGFIEFFKGVFAGNWEQAFNGLKQVFSGFVNNIINIFNYVMSFLKDRVTTWGSVIGNAFGGAFKGVVNAVLRTIENIINTPIRAINGLISTVNTLPGVNINTLHTFSFPRLKVGGIVNMPNKGTMIGGAIAGESGREGVLPLTDTQAMATLGREIGKYININATVPVYVGNRQIAREIRKIDAEDSFAFNV